MITEAGRRHQTPKCVNKDTGPKACVPATNTRRIPIDQVSGIVLAMISGFFNQRGGEAITRTREPEEK